MGYDGDTPDVPFLEQVAHAEGIMLSVFLSIVRFQDDVRTLFYYLSELTRSHGVLGVRPTDGFGRVFLVGYPIFS